MQVWIGGFWAGFWMYFRSLHVLIKYLWTGKMHVETNFWIHFLLFNNRNKWSHGLSLWISVKICCQRIVCLDLPRPPLASLRPLSFCVACDADIFPFYCSTTDGPSLACKEMTRNTFVQALKPVLFQQPPPGVVRGHILPLTSQDSKRIWRSRRGRKRWSWTPWSQSLHLHPNPLEAFARLAFPVLPVHTKNTKWGKKNTVQLLRNLSNGRFIRAWTTTRMPGEHFQLL